MDFIFRRALAAEVLSTMGLKWCGADWVTACSVGLEVSRGPQKVENLCLTALTSGYTFPPTSQCLLAPRIINGK